MSVTETSVRFHPGRILITQGAMIELPIEDILKALVRHLSGDWGELEELDWKANDEALEYGGRIFSRFKTREGNRYWIITECDRSVTTVLLPREY